METGIWSISKNKYLTEEELEEFQELVIKDIKLTRIPSDVEVPDLKISAEDRKELLSNKHIWIYCLHSVRRELELQMSQYKLDKKEKQFQLDKETDPKVISDIKNWLIVKGRWRSQAMKMLSVVEQKVIYLKTMLNQHTIKK